MVTRLSDLMAKALSPSLVMVITGLLLLASFLGGEVSRQPAPGQVADPEPLHELLKVVALRQLELAADEVGHGARCCWWVLVYWCQGAGTGSTFWDTGSSRVKNIKEYVLEIGVKHANYPDANLNLHKVYTVH